MICLVNRTSEVFNLIYPEIKPAIELMQQADLRITKQRQDLLHYLNQYQDYYLPVKQVDSYLRQRYARMSYETVYRNIDELAALDIIEKRMFESGLHVKYQCDFKHTQHSHFICQNCGLVVELNEPPMTLFQGQIPEYKIKSQKLEVFGLCPACQAKGIQ